MSFEALDLFSAAAGGWTLGLHRAGFRTIAACEAVAWRRALYAENNPGIPIYDDVRTLSAAGLLSDLGRLPNAIVGSPPCQDISSANTKGKGVHGERSGLFFEAVRLIGECRPRWFALENSANLRTRGADAILAALEAFGYACWPFVVRASDIGANHERARSWLIGCDPEQVAESNGDGWEGRRLGLDLSDADDPDHANRIGEGPFGSVLAGASAEHEGSIAGYAAGLGHEGGRAWRHGTHGNGAPHAGHSAQDGRRQGLSRRCEDAAGGQAEPTRGDVGNADGESSPARDCAAEREGGSPTSRGSQRSPTEPRRDGSLHAPNAGGSDPTGWDALGGWSQSEEDAYRIRPHGRDERQPPANTDQAGQADGCLEPGLRPEEVAWHGRSDGRCDDGQGIGQMGLRADHRLDPDGTWADWSLDDLAGRLWLDDGLSASVAGTRVALGTPKGTSAASLIVEAYGDAVVPQIPEAIGRAILRVEAALAAVHQSERLAA